MQQRPAVQAALAAFGGGLAAFALAGCSGQDSAGSVNINVGSEQHRTSSYSVPGPVQSLVVDDQVGNVEVTGTGSGGASVTEHIVYQSTAPQTSHSVSVGTLTLNSNCPSDDGCGVSYDVRVPRAATVQVTDGVGVIKLDSLSGRITAHTTGDIGLSSMSGPVQATSDTGSISGTNISSARTALRSSVGSVEATFSAAPTSVLATTSVGSVILHVPGNVSYKVDAQASLGSTRISVPTSADSSHAITSTTSTGTVTIEGT